MKAQLGLAGVLFGAGAWVRAAQAYESATTLAGDEQDLTTQVDALRMAAWSWERAGEEDHAWTIGLDALGVAEKMTEGALERSTVSWLGELLLRLSEDGAKLEGERKRVSRRLAELLGSRWRR